MSDYITVKRTESLANDLFSLEEPWRRRFLDLVTSRAIGCVRSEQSPTREQVTIWLNDWDLYQQVASLLCAWQRA